MNTKTPRQALTTPLAHTTLTALISDLLCDYEIHHTFRKLSDGCERQCCLAKLPLCL